MTAVCGLMRSQASAPAHSTAIGAGATLQNTLPGTSTFVLGDATLEERSLTGTSHLLSASRTHVSSSRTGTARSLAPALGASLPLESSALDAISTLAFPEGGLALTSTQGNRCVGDASQHLHTVCLEKQEVLEAALADEDMVETLKLGNSSAEALRGCLPVASRPLGAPTTDDFYDDASDDECIPSDNLNSSLSFTKTLGGTGACGFTHTQDDTAIDLDASLSFTQTFGASAGIGSASRPIGDRACGSSTASEVVDKREGVERGAPSRNAVGANAGYATAGGVPGAAVAVNPVRAGAALDVDQHRLDAFASAVKGANMSATLQGDLLQLLEGIKDPPLQRRAGT